MKQRETLLIVDGDMCTLRSLRITFDHEYNVIATTNPLAVADLVAEHDPAVVIVDQAMPDTAGTEILAAVKAASAGTVCLLMTDGPVYPELQVSIDDIGIFATVQKPWRGEELLATVAAAMQAASDARAVESAAEERERKVEAPSTTPATAILVLGHYPRLVESLQKLYQDDHVVLMARSPEDALKSLAGHPVGVMLANIAGRPQRIMAMIRLVSSDFPLTRTLAITPVDDLAFATELEAEGLIHGHLENHPLQLALLRASADAAFEAARAGEARARRTRATPATDDLSAMARVKHFLRRLFSGGAAVPGH